jgi:hypothetical protein
MIRGVSSPSRSGFERYLPYMRSWEENPYQISTTVGTPAFESLNRIKQLSNAGAPVRTVPLRSQS